MEEWDPPTARPTVQPMDHPIPEWEEWVAMDQLTEVWEVMEVWEPMDQWEDMVEWVDME